MRRRVPGRGRVVRRPWGRRVQDVWGIRSRDRAADMGWGRRQRPERIRL